MTIISGHEVSGDIIMHNLMTIFCSLFQVLRMTRVLEVLYEYICQCDNDFGEERTILPMARAFRGVQVMLTVRFPNQGE